MMAKFIKPILLKIHNVYKKLLHQIFKNILILKDTIKRIKITCD